MNEKKISLQEAMDLIGTMTESHFRKYKEIKAQLPSFGPVNDAIVKDYIYGMDCWVAGEINYCFDIPKYFGKDLDRVRKNQIVDLLI